MNQSNTTDDRNLNHHYDEGYKKGYWDASIGIAAHLIRRTITLRSTAMRYWEKGYLDGYRDGLRKIKSKSLIK